MVVTLGGTVATGAAVVGATVVVKDATGASVTAVTDAQGKYAADVTGMAPPFLTRAPLPAGGALYCVATRPGTANVDSFTDLMVDAFFAVRGTTPEAVFPAMDASTDRPNAVEVQALEALVERTIQPWLVGNGIDPAAFDLVTTPFTADGLGYDHVLAISSITEGAPLVAPGTTGLAAPSTVIASISVADGGTLQTSTLTTEGGGTLTVGTVTTGPGGSSSSQDSTSIPPTTQAGDAEVAVAAALEALRAEVNLRGATLTSAHVQPFMAADLLEGGEDRTIYAAEVVTALRGVTIDSASISRIVAYDPANDVLSVEVALGLRQGLQTSSEKLGLVYKRVGTDYLIFGDQRVAGGTERLVQLETRTDSRSTGDTTQTSINVDLDAPEGTVQSITVTGPGGFSSTPLQQGSSTRTQILEPTPTTTLPYVTDQFFLNSGPVALPTPPALYTFEIDRLPSGSQVTSFTAMGRAGEAFAFTVAPLTHSAAAAKGQTLTITWSLPTTYPVDRIELSGRMGDGVTEVEIESSPALLGATATSATLTFVPPAGTPNPSTFSPLNFNLSFNGPNGERSILIYEFDLP